MKEDYNVIQTRIGDLEKELAAIDGRQTEVYARIVGYYRSVKNWNKGKKEEYSHRIPFSEFSSDHTQTEISASQLKVAELF